jgi:hypothetical protein
VEVVVSVVVVVVVVSVVVFVSLKSDYMFLNYVLQSNACRQSKMYYLFIRTCNLT